MLCQDDILAQECRSFIAARHDGRVSYFRCARLVYAAERHHLDVHGHTIVSSPFRASHDGAVAKHVYELMVEQRHSPMDMMPLGTGLRPWPQRPLNQLPRSALLALEYAIELYRDTRDTVLAQTFRSWPEWGGARKLPSDIAISDVLRALGKRHSDVAEIIPSFVDSPSVGTVAIAN